MKIQGKITERDEELAQTLRHSASSVKLVKNGIVIDPWETDDGIFIIPESTKQIHLFLNLSEFGGGMTKTGSATVVCGVSGKPLKPYKIFRHGDLACNTHALFSVPEKAITIRAEKNRQIVIREHKIVITAPRRACIHSETLWTGNFLELPNRLSRYQNAVDAAREKAYCYHCRCVHYAQI